ncbi:MAG: SprB repeat, partial [Bacteroidota bacterium]
MNLRLFLILLTVNISMVSFAQPCNMILTTSVNNAMGGGPNGTINLSVNGGTPPYTYVWSNGQT